MGKIIAEYGHNEGLMAPDGARESHEGRWKWAVNTRLEPRIMAKAGSPALPRQILNPVPLLIMPEGEGHLGEFVGAHQKVDYDGWKLQHEGAD